MRNALFAVISIGIGLALSLLLLEGILRFLPVNDSMASRKSVDAENPIRTLKPNGEFAYSKGWDFALHNRVRTNNYGFVNDQDYDPKDDSPLLAVIGDSYIEALMVPYAETLQGRLAEEFKGKGRVYSFALSGDPLSQYLANARFVRDEFHPDAMIFVIIGNDFDESMSEYRQYPGSHYFFPNGSGGRDLRLVEYHARHASKLHEWGRKLGLNKSALVRHVRSNLPALQMQLAVMRAGKTPGVVGNTAAEALPERMRLSKEAVDTFFAMLPKCSGLPKERILFVVDGARPELYEGRLDDVADSYFALMRDYFISAADRLGYPVVDMEPLFVEGFREHGERFEHPEDGHWSGVGHEAVFEAVKGHPVVQGVLGP